jgi:glucosamine-6-phosphate deaminase
MSTQDNKLSCFEAGTLKVEIYTSPRAAEEAAARASAETMQQLRRHGANFGVIFATGASQLDALRALVSLRDLPWSSVSGFHMDEYEGISVSHPASFRRYMREHLTERVQMRDFSEIDGSAADPNLVCQKYAQNCVRVTRSCVYSESAKTDTWHSTPPSRPTLMILKI